jgi:carbamoyl-phosphate synthase large subunit
MKLLLTGAGGSASSNVLDALKLSTLDLDIIGVDSSQRMIALSAASQKFLVPHATDEEYLSDIIKLVEKYSIQVIHVQPDSEVNVLSANREKLNASIFLPDQDAIDLARDKEKFAVAMRKAAVPVPISGDGGGKLEFIQVCSELLRSVPKLWVRARTGAGSRASLPVTSTSQAVNWIEWWIQEKNLAWEDFQVSEFLPGQEYALQTVWQNGLLISAEARVRISYLYGFLTPSGQSSTPSVARTTSNPEVYEVGLNAIRALSKNPHGIFCVDMKTDFDEKIKVTEINAGRFFTTSNFFAHAGVNMPEMSVRGALGETLSPIGVGTLGDDLFWIRMVDMGFKLVHRDEIESYARVRDF